MAIKRKFRRSSCRGVEKMLWLNHRRKVSWTTRNSRYYILYYTVSCYFMLFCYFVVMLYHVVWCYFMLCYACVVLCEVMWCDVMLFYVMLRYNVWYYVMSFCAVFILCYIKMWCCFALCYILLYYDMLTVSVYVTIFYGNVTSGNIWIPEKWSILKFKMYA